MYRSLVSLAVAAGALATAFLTIIAPTPVTAARNAVIRTRAATPKADFVFIIDATPSMGDEIAAVKSGLAGFVSGLQNENIDARFAVVLFGGAPELVQDFTNSLVDTTSTFNQISVNGAVAGFQNAHNINPEAGLEAIRMVLGASSEVLTSNNVGGNGILTFRPDANKNLILVTDEDSDLPFYASNRQPGQAGTEPPSPLTAPWQAEVTATAQAIIQNNAYINMLINTSDPPAVNQYGNPASSVSDPNFLNYDPAATLANLIAGNLGDCLQAQVLSAGLIGRSFNITQINTPNFINNFYAAKVEEVVESNVPPVFVDSPFGTCLTAPPIEVSVGVPYQLVVNAQAPELEQLTNMIVDEGGFVGAVCGVVPGQTATATCILTAVAAQVGQTFTFTFVAVDNGTPNLTSTLKVCVKVVESPLSVTLQSFTARMLPSLDARIAWITAAEFENAGFNVYRSVRPNGAAMVQLNDSLIPAMGTPFSGESYEWIDADAQPGVMNFYFLEDMNIFGVSTMHGPVGVLIPE